MTIDRSSLLKIARGEDERVLFSRLLDKIDMAQNRGIPYCTGFLSPGERAAAEKLLAAAGHPRSLFYGGYGEAERRVCLFLPDWQEEDDAIAWAPLGLLRCSYSDKSVITHRDMLGSLMALGIKRDKTGDIIVNPGFSDVIILSDIGEYLLTSLTSAGRAKVSTKLLPLSELSSPRSDSRRVRATVSSLRLDSLISAAFNLARGKAAELAVSGRVQLNCSECLKPDRSLTEGDTVACRGLGKFRLTAVGGLSKKGRLCVEIEVWGKK